MKYIDTNIFLRFLEGKKEVVDWFAKLETSKETYLVPSVVLYELHWTMASFYQENKEKIATYLERIIHSAYLKIVFEHDVEKMMDLYKNSTIKYTDCVIASFMNEGDEIVSYDKHFDKVKGISRVEP